MLLRGGESFALMCDLRHSYKDNWKAAMPLFLEILQSSNQKGDLWAFQVFWGQWEWEFLFVSQTSRNHGNSPGHYIDFSQLRCILKALWMPLKVNTIKPKPWTMVGRRGRLGWKNDSPLGTEASGYSQTISFCFESFYTPKIQLATIQEICGDISSVFSLSLCQSNCANWKWLMEML